MIDVHGEKNGLDNQITSQCGGERPQIHVQ